MNYYAIFCKESPRWFGASSNDQRGWQVIPRSVMESELLQHDEKLKWW